MCFFCVFSRKKISPNIYTFDFQSFVKTVIEWLFLPLQRQFFSYIPISALIVGFSANQKADFTRLRVVSSKDSTCDAYACSRHGACPDSSSAWFFSPDAYSGPTWPCHIAWRSVSHSAPSDALPCASHSTPTRHTSRTTAATPTCTILQAFLFSWH